jgi:hypothetical protein
MGGGPSSSVLAQNEILSNIGKYGKAFNIYSSFTTSRIEREEAAAENLLQNIDFKLGLNLELDRKVMKTYCEQIIGVARIRYGYYDHLKMTKVN